MSAPSRKELQYLAARIASIAKGNDETDFPEPREDHDPETCEVCDRIAALIAEAILQALAEPASSPCGTESMAEPASAPRAGESSSDQSTRSLHPKGDR